MFRFHRVYLLTMVLAILTIFTATVAAQSTQESSELLAQEALIKDIEEYALAMGVSFEEAAQRLSLQGAIGDLEAQLAMNEQSTYAGLWVQH